MKKIDAKLAPKDMNRKNYKTYLDNAATSFPKPDSTINRMFEFAKSHVLTTRRRGYASKNMTEDIVEETRTLLLNIIGGEEGDKLIFTLNSTDAINIILKDVLNKGDHVITSPFEHSAVSRTLIDLSRKGLITISKATPNLKGKITANEIEPLITSKTRLVAIVHGSNVIGDIIADHNIGELTRKKGILNFLDASQTVGSYPVDVSKNNIDLMAFSGHKSLLGPSGIGCLFANKEIKLNQFRHGGTGHKSEDDYIVPSSACDYETGTQNVLGIIGLNASLKFINTEGLTNTINFKKEITKYCISQLQKIDDVRLYGNLSDKERLPIVSFNIKNFSPVHDVGPILENAFGIITRAGLHCSPWTHKHIETFPEGTIRVSFGIFNTKEDVDKLVEAIQNIKAALEDFGENKSHYKL